MKVFAAILLLATMAQSRPRHILVPYDDEIEQPQVMINILLISRITLGYENTVFGVSSPGTQNYIIMFQLRIKKVTRKFQVCSCVLF